MNTETLKYIDNSPPLGLVADLPSPDKADVRGKAADVKIKVLTTSDQIRAIMPAWSALANSLVESGNKGSVFQGDAWVRAYLSYADKCRHPIRHYVMTAWHGGQLVGILPLGVRREKTLTIMTGLSEPFQQYTEMLVLPDWDASKILDDMLKTIRKTGPDVLHLGQVRKDSILFSAAETKTLITGEKDYALQVDLQSFQDFSEYKNSRSQKNRKIMRNAVNRLNRVGLWEKIATTKPDELAPIIHETFLGRQEALAEKGMTSRAFSTDDMQLFIDCMTDEMGPTGEVIAFNQTIDGKFLSSQFGVLNGTTYHAYMNHWNTNFSAMSPGKLQLGDVIEHCMNQGITTIDFMIPAMPYKKIWATHCVPVHDLVLSFTAKGYFYDRIWLNRLRPFVKSLFTKLGSGVRSRILSLFGLG